jgi:hypothetical protein
MRSLPDRLLWCAGGLTYVFGQLFVGIALAIVLILPADRRQLSVLD